MGVALIATVFYAQWAIPGDVQRFGFYVVALLLVMLATTPLAIRVTGWREPVHGLLSLPDWMASVRALNNRVRIRSVRFARDSTDSQMAHVVHRIGQATSRFGAITRMGRRQIMWFEGGNVAVAPSDESLLKWSGGLVRELKKTDFADNGKEAFMAAQRLGIIDDSLPNQCSNDGVAYLIPTLLRKFRRLFPDGVVFDLKGGGRESGDALSPAKCRDIMFNAVKYSKDFSQPGRNADFDVTTLLVDGQIWLIFAIPMKAGTRARRQWRTRIKKMNLAITCGAGIKV
jgi:hypothetical protein